jgi:hypothetical protein
MAASLHILWMAILICAVCGCYDHTPESTKIRAIGAELRGYADAARHLARDCGEERVVSSSLPGALCTNPGWPGWKGPYLDGAPPATDPWGTTVKYTKSGRRLRIVSAGPDKNFNTRDDVAVEINLSE